MLTREVLSQHLPSLHLHDKVHKRRQHETVLTENDHALLSALEQSFSSFSVKEEDHFLKAVQLAADNGLSLVPVINEENELTGTVTYTELLRHASAFMSLNEPGGLIVLELPSNQYSFNEISKLVETNDAQITQLNTSNDAETGTMQVTLRINKTEISDILATFQRYEYNVKYFFGEEQYANELRSNYDNLMNYLKI